MKSKLYNNKRKKSVIIQILSMVIIASVAFSVMVAFSGCRNEKKDLDKSSSVHEKIKDEYSKDEYSKVETTVKETIAESSAKQTKEQSNSKTNNKNNELSDEFKSAMDSYEEFIDEYVAFMKKYNKSGGTDINLLSDYADYLEKYSSFCSDFEKWEDKDLNQAEIDYYIEVQKRVSKKMLDVVQ